MSANTVASCRTVCSTVLNRVGSLLRILVNKVNNMCFEGGIDEIHLNFCHLAKLAVATSNRIYGIDYASNMCGVSFGVSWSDS